MDDKLDLTGLKAERIEVLEKRIKMLKRLIKISAVGLIAAGLIAYLSVKNKSEKTSQGLSELERLSLVEKPISDDNKYTNIPAAPEGYEYWKTLTVEATAYCLCKKCCGPNAQGKTADGRKIELSDYIISRDPKIIPDKTLVFVPGYTPEGIFAEPRDKGSKIKGNKIDVLMTVPKKYKDPHERAIHWGRKTLDIVLYKPK